MAFKRSDWNDLIDSVNSVITNPPSGCTARPPIEHVGPSTIWRKSHVRQLQDAISATCNSIVFDAIPDLWKQSIVDEIRSKLTQAWCNSSDCGPEDVAAARAEHGLMMLVLSVIPGVYSNCNGNPAAPDTTACALVNGLPLAMPGFSGREWRLKRYTSPAMKTPGPWRLASLAAMALCIALGISASNDGPGV